jgi:hypothetical protein
MELAPSTHFVPAADLRRPLPPPPPVGLLTVEDARLAASSGLERELDAFYVGLLQFERDAQREGIVYKAENQRLRIDLVEGPVRRDDMRMLGVVVKSLEDAMRKLTEAQWLYSRERGVAGGEDRLLLMDPAGNWLRIVQSQAIL